MSPKPQHRRGLHEEIVPGTSLWEVAGKTGGDQNGLNLRSATWDNDLANRLTGRQVPGYFEVVGQANATANVTVNTAATYRHGEYFRKEVAVANTLVPVYSTVNVLAQWGTTNEPVTGYQFVPQMQEGFVYDNDGNLTQDGRWTYTWDAENRLVTMTTRADVTVAPVRRIEFQYDWQGRRIAKLVYDARTGGTLLSTARYLYDGWNLLMELNGSNAKVRGFMWGTDLSGTMQGAGGVGGLLKVTYYGTATTNCFVGYDGNGNVTLLADAATGAVLGQYEYGPFGETIRITGPSTGSMAKSNPFRFATKYQDDETDLLYYGYRYYSPGLGRWLSRDPIQERGGVNLYGFVGNDPIKNYDQLGLLFGDEPPELPGLGESLIPIYGSLEYVDYYSAQGNYGASAFYSVMAVSDVFLVRSIVTGLGKGCWKIGSHTWKATRAWYGKSRDLVANTEVHHWLLQQNQGIGKYFPDIIVNQPWNLVPIESQVINGVQYSSKTIHLAAHGTSKQLTLNWAERALYATPNWAKWAAFDMNLHAVTEFNRACNCERNSPNQTIILYTAT